MNRPQIYEQQRPGAADAFETGQAAPGLTSSKTQGRFIQPDLDPLLRLQSHAWPPAVAQDLCMSITLERHVAAVDHVDPPSASHAHALDVLGVLSAGDLARIRPHRIHTPLRLAMFHMAAEEAVKRLVRLQDVSRLCTPVAGAVEGAASWSAPSAPPALGTAGRAASGAAAPSWPAWLGPAPFVCLHKLAS